MKNVARAFGEETHRGVLRALPGKPPERNPEEGPWATLAPGAMPPLMFQLRLATGRMQSFAYSDLREIDAVNEGQVRLYLLSMHKLRITIEGRHLGELGRCFACASIRWVREVDPRDDDRRDEEPQVVSIVVEQLAG